VSRAVALLAFTHIGQINPGPSSQEFVVLQAFYPAQKGRSGITMATGGGFPELRETRASTHRETAKRVDATESCGACDRDPAGFGRAPRVRWRGGNHGRREEQPDCTREARGQTGIHAPAPRYSSPP
jgi:hypothetical protein